MRRFLLHVARRVRYFGFDRYCTVCRRESSQFLPHGPYLRRDDARCPFCSSLERHRACAIVYDWLPKTQPDVLHFAPERGLAPAIKRLKPRRYTTADIEPGRADQVLDLTDLDVDDESWDVVIANHVLEHIQDDAAALGEIYRVLRPGGCAILTVPQDLGRIATDEDAGVTDPAERLQRWGHPGHVRRYGMDAEHRFAAPGFRITTRHPWRDCRPRDRRQLGLWEKDQVFVCWKPREPAAA